MDGVGRIARAGITALALLLLVPWHPDTFRTDPDLSWQLLLHEAFVRHLLWGRDLIFTYGPWGFVSVGYAPATYVWSIAAWCAIAVCVAGGLLALPGGVRTSPSARGWVAALAIVILSANVSPVHDYLFFSVLFLLIAVWFESGNLAWTTALAAVAALVSLIKFTFFAGAAIAVAGISIDQIVRKRRFPVPLIAFLFAFTLFWLVAGQRGNLADWLRTSAEMSAGYSGGLPLDYGWAADWLNAVAFLAAGTLLLWKRGILFGATLGGLFFVVWKASFVRVDHVWIGATFLLFAAVIAATTFSSARRPAIIALIVAAVLFGSVREEYPMEWIRDIGHQSLALASLITSGTAPMNRAYGAILSGYRSSAPDAAGLPQPVDVYPSAQGVRIAFGFDPAYRPVPQSYTAYTPHFDAIDAAHLASSSAPRSLLIDYGRLDNHLATIEDPASWLLFLSHYQVARRSGSFLILERRAVPLAMHEEHLRDIEVRSGVPIDLGEPGIVVARMDLRETLTGSIVRFLLRGASVRIFVDGQRFRMVPPVAGDGFILSPSLPNFASVESLLDGRPLPLVKRITITTDPPSDFAIRWPVRMSLSRLVIERRQ